MSMARGFQIRLSGLRVLRKGRVVGEVPWAEMRKVGHYYAIPNELRGENPELPRSFSLYPSPANRTLERLRTRQLCAQLRRGEFSRALVLKSDAAIWWAIALQIGSLVALVFVGPLLSGGSWRKGLSHTAEWMRQGWNEGGRTCFVLLCLILALGIVPLIAAACFCVYRAIRESRAHRRTGALVALRFHRDGVTVDRLDGRRVFYPWTDLIQIHKAELAFACGARLHLPHRQSLEYGDALDMLRAAFPHATQPGPRPRELIWRWLRWFILAGLIFEAGARTGLLHPNPPGANFGLGLALWAFFWLLVCCDETRVDRRWRHYLARRRARRGG
jgi:hypothetical protein